MANYRVALTFVANTDSGLGTFAADVIDSMTDNAAFPTPAIPLATLQATLDAYLAAKTASDLGGVVATAVKNQARETLVEQLRTQAAYVQSKAPQDLPMLLSSGFDATSRNRAQSPLAAPQILRIRNERTEQLVLDLKRVPNTRVYEIQRREGNGPWITVGGFTRSRRLVVEGLTPGTIYTFQARAIGGSTGQSDWSDPVSHMSI
jgi:Fibronectin type III domain